MADLTRRTVLKAAPDRESEVMRLFRERCAARDTINDTDWTGVENAEKLQEQLCLRMVEAEDAMLEVPTASITDLAAKVLAHTDNGEGWLTNSDGGLIVLAELGALLGVAVPTDRD
jgi:hypothetical protein